MSLYEGWIKAKAVLGAKLIQLAKTVDPQKIVNGSIWCSGRRIKMAHNERIDVIPGLSYMPRGVIAGKPPVWASVSTITIKSGTKCIDSTGKYMVEFTQDETVSIAASGADGLDAGSEITSAHYFLYAIWDSKGVNAPKGLFSAVNESVSGSITPPAGYDVKCQMPYSVRNDGSGNFLKQWVSGGWPYAPEIRYEVAFSSSAGAGTTQVLNAGIATSFTDISNLPNFISPLSTTAIFAITGSRTATNQDIYLRRKGESHNGIPLRVVVDSTLSYQERKIQTDSSQLAQYEIAGTGANVTLDAAGFVVDKAMY